MGRVLLAWELGENFGHLVRQRTIAGKLRELGHVPILAVRDTRVAHEILQGADLPFVQSPRPSVQTYKSGGLVSYSDILLASGYADTKTLLGLVQGWLGLYASCQIDLVMIDHAPTAQLAAQISQTKSLLACTGFALPPASTPTPSIRPWEFTRKDQLRKVEEMAVSSMNECIRKLGGRQLDRVVDIFADTATAMVTFPELDHYGARPDLKYVGAIEYYDGGAVPVWPKGQGKRIFLYFRAASLVADKVMEALTAFPGVAICSIPDASADFRKKHESERVQIVTSPLDLRRVLETADLTITYGGLGLVSASALAGVPTLVIPQHSEQYLTAQRVAALGIGILFNQKSKLGNLGQHIEYILGANGMSDQAKRFSARHRNHQSSISAALVAEEASALMRT